MIEKRYLEYGPWSQTAYVHPRASKNSVHRSQLDFTKEKTQRLNILNGDGTTIEFDGSDCKHLRLGFSGGTDDPSIELSLRHFISDPWTAHYFTPTTGYKFTAFANSETDFVFKENDHLWTQPCDSNQCGRSRDCQEVLRHLRETEGITFQASNFHRGGI
jgi:hypothetical protein